METSKFFKCSLSKLLVANARFDCSVAMNGGEFHFSHDLKGFFFFVSSSTGCKLLELRNLSLVNAVLTVVCLRQM